MRQKAEPYVLTLLTVRTHSSNVNHLSFISCCEKQKKLSVKGQCVFGKEAWKEGEGATDMCMPYRTFLGHFSITPAFT